MLIFRKYKVIDGRIDWYDRMRIEGIFRAFEEADDQDIDRGPWKERADRSQPASPLTRHLRRTVVIIISNV